MMFSFSLPKWAEEADSATGGRAVKSAVIAMSSGLVRLVGSLGTAIILGRILTPEDFGLVGMLAPIMAIVMIFADAGVSQYTLQSKKLSQNEMSLTFWIGALFACGLFLLVVALSPLVAWFYDDERLPLVLVVMATGLLLSIFSMQHNALVKRCFRQDIYAYAEIAGAIAGIVFGIILALQGAGYWALVSIPLSRLAAHSVVTLIMTRWLPSPTSFKQTKKIKEITLFGFYIVAGSVIGVLVKNVDKVALGWRFGAVEVGYYSMAYSIMMLPFLQVMTPVGGAAVPYLSQIVKRKESLDEAIKWIINGLGLLVVPSMLWAAIASEKLLPFVIGEQWNGSVNIFSILAIASVTLMFGTPVGWMLVASGKPKYTARWLGITFIPIIIAYFVGATWGGIGVAFSLLVVHTVSIFGFSIYASKYIEFNARKYLFTVVCAITAGIPSALVTQWIFHTFTEWQTLVLLVVSYLAAIGTSLLSYAVVMGKKDVGLVVEKIRRKKQVAV